MNCCDLVAGPFIANFNQHSSSQFSNCPPPIIGANQTHELQYNTIETQQFAYCLHFLLINNYVYMPRHLETKDN
jgi:hypothetical protein